MKSPNRKIASFLLLPALLWLWSCDLKATAGIYCPDGTVISSSNVAPCHNNTGTPHSTERSNKNQSEKSDCKHCLETEWENVTNFFPKTNPSPELLTAIFLSELLFTKESGNPNRLEFLYSLENFSTKVKSSPTLSQNQRIRI